MIFVSKKSSSDNTIGEKKKPTMEKITAKNTEKSMSTEAIAATRARLEKFATEENIDISNLNRKSTTADPTVDTRFAWISTQITLENIDRVHLPPGFQPEPPKPVFREGGQREEYIAYMRERLLYEEWENSLLLWYRKSALGKQEIK